MQLLPGFVRPYRKAQFLESLMRNQIDTFIDDDFERILQPEIHAEHLADVAVAPNRGRRQTATVHVVVVVGGVIREV